MTHPTSDPGTPVTPESLLEDFQNGPGPGTLEVRDCYGYIMDCPGAPKALQNPMKSYSESIPESTKVSHNPHIFTYLHLAGSPSPSNGCAICGEPELHAIHGYTGD